MKQVSILIAIRNEEHTLPRLLSSIANLEYPKENLQVIIANDESTDCSLEILNAFAVDKPWFKLVNLADLKISIDIPKGKMRALAAIESQATGDYLLFTDADIALPSTWVQGMLSGFSENIGVLNGVTRVKNTSFWARMQNIEWLTALYIMHINANWGVPSTGMGNNLGMSREAFDAVGGYAGIGFSIVEDYAIYKAIIAKGYGYKHMFEPAVLAETLEAENYLEQRRRWMTGAFKSDSYLLYLSLGQAAFFPLLIALLIFYPIWALAIFIVQLGVIIFLGFKINCLLFTQNSHEKAKISYFDLLCFVFYVSIGSMVQLLYYHLGKKIVWKGRNYIK